MHTLSLLKKYNTHVPRYTSYPAIPDWNQGLGGEEWISSFSDALHSDPNLALYLHLPFCEQLCTFCGCHKIITRNHNVEMPYIKALKNELAAYKRAIPRDVKLQEVHLGGGTPTFFSPANLKSILEEAFTHLSLQEDALLSYEAHPGVTETEHLEALYDLGFRRISFGIQDMDATVQQTINRRQTPEQVRAVVEEARGIGYESINFDLVYGLPKQNQETLAYTLDFVQKLKPDRIAFYSYAHIPWMKPSQKLFKTEDIPDAQHKAHLFLMGKKALESMGYTSIGLDHFALQTDGLYQAFVNGSLNRSFMGYTEKAVKNLLGLGLSSISQIPAGYVQNPAMYTHYMKQYRHSEPQEFTFLRSHRMSPEEQVIYKKIQEIFCYGRCSFEGLKINNTLLEQMIDDGIVVKEDKYVSVAQPDGQLFLRQLASTIDTHYKVNQRLKFSKGV